MPRTCDVDAKLKALRDFVRRERRMPGYREMLLVLAALGVAAVLAFWRARPP